MFLVDITVTKTICWKVNECASNFGILPFTSNKFLGIEINSYLLYKKCIKMLLALHGHLYSFHILKFKVN